MKTILTPFFFIAALSAYSQSQTVDTIGSAHRVFSCQGTYSQGFKLTNGPSQTGIARLHGKRNLNQGLIAPLSVHLGQERAENKMVFLLSPDELSFSGAQSAGQLDQYLQDAASRYVAIQIVTHPPGGSPDVLSMLIKQAASTTPAIFGPVPAYLNGDEIEFAPNDKAKYHNLTIIWNANNRQLVVGFGDRMRIQHCQDLVKDVFKGDPAVYVMMAGATYMTADSQQVCLRSNDFAFNCCPSRPSCPNPADFDLGWYGAGRLEDGLWSSTGNKVRQNQRGGPSVFMLPLALLNVEMNFKVRVSSNGAAQLPRNNWGFVLGMVDPQCNTTRHQYWLFNWRGEPGATCNGQYSADAGYLLAKANGNIGMGCGKGETADYFWANRDDNLVFDVVQPALGSPGWVFDSMYQFQVTYTFGSIVIKVNEKTIVEYPGCFEPGFFGFFTYEQHNVEFSDFSYEHHVYFSMDTDTTVCTNDPITFDCYNSCDNKVDSFFISGIEWKFGDGASTGFLSGGERLFSTKHTFAQPGNYEVVMVARDVNGCRGEAKQLLQVVPIPDTLELGTKNASCSGNSDGAVTILNPLSELLYSIDGVMFSGDTVFLGLNTGNHLLHVQNTDFCILKLPFIIGAPKPISVDLEAKGVIALGDTAKLTAIVQSNGIPIETYVWSTGDTCRFCRIVTDRPSKTTSYSLTVTDTLRCTATAQKTIEVIDSMRIYVPNAFLPDVNGENDYFTVFGGNEIARINCFRVFNRWGNLLHEATNFMPGDPSAAWKGYDRRNRPQLPGVYVGIVEYTLINDQKRKRGFDILLVR